VDCEEKDDDAIKRKGEFAGRVNMHAYYEY
jgi:hypothetical protein